MGEFLKLIWQVGLQIGRSFNDFYTLITFNYAIDVSFFNIRDLNGQLVSTINVSALSIFTPAFILILLVIAFFGMLKRSVPLI